MRLFELEKMEDDEMASKFISIVSILKVFSDMLFDKILAHPIKFVRVFKFSLKLKKIATTAQNTQDKGEKLDSTISLVEMILKYRHTNPEEMEIIFETLEEILQKYKSNPDIKQKILNIIEHNSSK